MKSNIFKRMLFSVVKYTPIITKKAAIWYLKNHEYEIRKDRKKI